MTSRRGLPTAAVVVLALVAFTAIDWVQGRKSGVGFGRALVLGAAQVAGWVLLAPGARALGRRFTLRPAPRPAALLVHGGFAAAFALVKSAVDVGVAQMLVAGVPPAGPGFAGNALVYILLAVGAAREPGRATPTTPTPQP